MSSKTPGYVYILTNPSFREDWIKIGKSSRTVDVRSKELDNTAVPLPFEIFATMKTVKYDDAERLVHRYIERFTNLRIRNNREFFNLKPEEALEIFRDVALVIDDAEIKVYDNKNDFKVEEKVFLKGLNHDNPVVRMQKRREPVPSNGRRTASEKYYHEVWKSFLERYLPENPSNVFDIPNIKFYWDNFITISIGITNINIQLVYSIKKKSATVQLVFHEDADKKLFDAMLKHKEKAEQFIGYSLTWRRDEGFRNSTIDLYRTCDFDIPTEREDAFNWYKEYAEKFIEFFKPIIESW